MNTRFDIEMYETAERKCRRCNNPAVFINATDKFYCVRCNMTLPEWMVKR